MCNVKCLKSADMFPVIGELLDGGQNVRIVVTGTSMYPFLRENIDHVELQKADCNNIRRGDIVLYIRRSGEYILHRVLKKDNGQFNMIGDNQQWIEGPIYPDQVVASVASVFRNGKKIECGGIGWKILSLMWLNIIPVRGKANCVLRKLGV
jgi:Predicted transcriptional regulator